MRKLATAAAVSLALASGGAFGLGLGDIEMRSALNQPMNAEIPLTSVENGELDGMVVRLADESAFARAGIDRSAALTDLLFSVESGGGRPLIRITSARAVTEPFLNFLLEVDWPQGRMVREYTVLLDPPVFMTEGASVRDGSGEQRAVVDAESALVAPAPIERAGVEPVAERTVDGFDVELVGSDEEIADDTLVGSDGGVGSLDALDADSATLEGDEEIRALSDPAAPNTDAVAQGGADGGAGALGDDAFEVELIGAGIEVGDEAGAERTIFFETFIWKDDEIGREFRDLFVARAREGIDVYLVYDLMGNGLLGRSRVRFPSDVPTLHVQRFFPFKRLIHLLMPSRYNLTHRKTLVIDNRVGYVGGYNLGDEYRTRWRDTHMSITGDGALLRNEAQQIRHKLGESVELLAS